MSVLHNEYLHTQLIMEARKRDKPGKLPWSCMSGLLHESADIPKC